MSKKNKNLTDYIYSQSNAKANTKIPILKGCSNKECFCTGKCQEVIGWREKLPSEL